MIGVNALRNLCSGRILHILLLMPAVSVISFWFLGWIALVGTAVLTSVLVFLGSDSLALEKLGSKKKNQIDERPEGQILELLGHYVPQSSIPGMTAACFVVAFDDRAKLERHGSEAMQLIYRKSHSRLAKVARSLDAIATMADGNIAIALAPMRSMDIETAIQIAARFQAAATLPVEVNGLTLHPSVSVGFCAAGRSSADTAQGLLDAAIVAADEAQQNGPGAIRAYRREMGQRRADLAELRLSVQQALNEGQISPWFQPQICADTGKITGFEALARWQHPERGIIMPADFLPAIHETGLSERMYEVILAGALTALKNWDEAKLDIAHVSVNFSAAELRNPRLTERLKWELDRLAIAPGRLYVEVLETVAAQSGDDIIMSNLAKIAELGCKIDLDDFGTGQAAIGNIKRFSVKRIKIDRSFVKHVDTDPDQKRMVAAIQSLAERLGLETVAEGVETAGEHSTLSQLGCSYVQGFGIGRPMPLENTHDWITQHRRGSVPFPSNA